jgi:MtN3 and saliva related transmembrane protein
MGWLRIHTEWIGTLAAILTTVAFFPQVLRTWRMRKQEQGQELSGAMLGLFGSGVGLWFVYGYLRMSGPLMAANGVTGLLILAIVAVKLFHTSRESRDSGGGSALPQANDDDQCVNGRLPKGA